MFKFKKRFNFVSFLYCAVIYWGSSGLISAASQERLYQIKADFMADRVTIVVRHGGDNDLIGMPMTSDKKPDYILPIAVADDGSILQVKRSYFLHKIAPRMCMRNGCLGRQQLQCLCSKYAYCSHDCRARDWYVQHKFECTTKP